MTFVLSLGEIVLVQPIRLGVGVLARALGREPGSPQQLQVPPMSGEWLRQHETDADKHQYWI